MAILGEVRKSGSGGAAPPDRAGAPARGTQLSRGVVPIAFMLMALHFLNFLNYATVISGYFNPPLVRSVLLVAFSLYLISATASNLRFHFRRSWDMYSICALALLSASYSPDPARTLKYAAWLTLSVYVGTELAARVRTPRDIIATLAIVLLPVSFFVATVNVALGPTVISTGRHFGALGSAHVDTAYAMNFICMFLALRAAPEGMFLLPNWLKLGMWGVLVWAIYQAVFGLTRSVWLCVTLTLVLYYFRRRLTIGTLAGTLFGGLVVILAIDYVGMDRILPDAVKGRIEVTEQRYEEGQIDPRLKGIQHALTYAKRNPQGAGYAMDSSHNSYMNMLLNLGWLGFLLAIVAVSRSVLLVFKRGFGWFLFFAIGSAGLLLHAFFEVQDMPGQANFMPLLVWYAFSRSRFVRDLRQPRRRRPNLIDA